MAACFLLATPLFTPPLGGQEPLVLTRLEGPIELDGLSDEEAWEAVDPLPVTMHAPAFLGVPTERTEIRVAYTDDHLYVAARLYDSEPSGIQGAAFNRNHLSTSSDWISVVLDTYNDKENALLFATTPTGLRTDYEIRDDAEAPNNVSWNTYWDVAVTQNEEGWFAEFRIPFSSLRFQDDGDEVVMGLIVWRYIARKNELTIFPAIPPNWGFFSINKPSQAQEVLLRGVRRPNPVYLTPYVLGGIGRETREDPDEAGIDHVDDTVRDIGLDAKYSITSNLTLDITANTDFAQVEADDQQVNLTRFSLFFPEKRQFFQERSSIFEFRTGQFDRLFHSRKIGLADGNPVRIYGGGRLVGRLGEWDLGLLNMQTASGHGHPSENFGVIRLRRRVLNENSNVGGLFTTRMGNDGRYNIAYGADAILRPFGTDYVSLNWAQTFDHTQNFEENHFLSSTLLRLRWERRTVSGPGYDVSLTRIGDTYDPGVGFVRRRGFLKFGDRLFYGWFADEGSTVLRQMVGLNGAIFLSTERDAMESYEVGPEWSLETKAGGRVMIRGTRHRDRPIRAFTLSDEVTVPAGDYVFHRLSGSYRWPWGGFVRGEVRGEAGSFYGGTRYGVGAAPTWHPSPHLELAGEYQYNQLRFDDRDQRLRTHIGRIRARLMANTTLTATTFLQYSSVVDGIIANLRIRYNPREGNDLYVVYNHQLNTDRDRVLTNLPLTDRRTLLVKYSHTLRSELW